MKKIILSIAALVIALPSFAQWIPSGNNTYFNTGNVGIGTTSPTTLFDVNGAYTSGSYSADINAFQPVAFHRYNGIGGVSYPGQFRWYTSPNNSLHKDAALYQLRAYDLGSNTENTVLTIRGDAMMGIGTNTPQSTLDIGKNQLTPAFRLGNSQYPSIYNSVWGLQSGAQSVMIFGNNGANEIRAGNTNAGGYLDFYTNNTADYTSASTGNLAMRLGSDGNIGIGTTDPLGYKLAVNGAAIATSMTVKLYNNWPDYVFKKDYKLPSLLEVKSFIDKNSHLPDMPSEQEVKDNGINLGEMVKLQTKKIEELTLYMIELQKQNIALQKQVLKIKKNHSR